VGPGTFLLVVPPGGQDAISEAAGGDLECVEQPDPLGTGHALLQALPHIGPQTKHILLLNGDMPLIRGETLQALINRHVQSEAVLTLLSVHLSPDIAEDLGRLARDEQGRPVAIIEAVEAAALHDSNAQPVDALVEANVGAYCLDATWARDALGGLQPHATGESYITDLVALAAEQHLVVEALVMDSSVEGLGVNTRLQLYYAEAAMQERLRSHWMLNGVTLRDSATAYFDVDVVLGEDVIIEPNTRLQGQTRLGPGVKVGPNAHLIDTQAEEDCRIGSSTLEGVILGPEVSVGPYCHLRPETRLERGVKIGSHVEIKNSSIGAGSRVGHFCYIGDAALGRLVNIGAGTVTCNYDGVAKQVTEIGDGAFIGSGSLLVAPVKIGARAITGAGAVITHDVPEAGKVAGVPARPMPHKMGESADGAPQAHAAAKERRGSTLG
jgi:bifunctional UDP-N-acetylglucosamine pyrophosphorylase/glucosamine-1-phosphate N-acetyltransferase